MPHIDVTFTTPEFRRGQEAAWAAFAKDPGSVPNAEVLALTSPEFAAGYRYEFREYIEPSPAHRIARAEVL